MALQGRDSMILVNDLGSFYPSMDHRKQLNGATFVASHIILILLAVPTFLPKPIKFICFIIVGWYFCNVIFAQTTGDVTSDFGLGSAIIVQYLLAFDYGLLTLPENLKDYHDNSRDRRTPISKRSLKDRIYWTLKLFSNPRGIGWTHEPSHLPPRPSPSTSRTRFVVERILLATCCFLVGTGAFQFEAKELLRGAPLHRRVMGSLSFGVGGVTMICGLNTVLSASVVGLGFSSPERWPLMFGSPLQLWSIRRFWNRFWHQLIRRAVLSYTSFILECIVPTKYVGSTCSQLARLYIAFFISAIAHTGGDIMATGKLGFRSFTFFMLQPVGITIEIFVSYLWRTLLPKDETEPPNLKHTPNMERTHKDHNNIEHISNGKDKSAVQTQDRIPPLWIRFIGYTWVAFWMLCTAPIMIDALYLARITANSGQS